MSKARDWNAVDAHFRNSAGPMRDRRLRRNVSRPNSQNIMKEYLDTTYICDFCGDESSYVKRIVVDTDYDRTISEAKYACEDCSQEKEEQRLMSHASHKR